MKAPDMSKRFPGTGSEESGTNGGGGNWAFTFSSTDLSHGTGEGEGDSWVAIPDKHSEAHMVYGPYVETIPAGNNIASFEIAVDNIDADSDAVVNLDIYDATAGAVLG